MAGQTLIIIIIFFQISYNNLISCELFTFGDGPSVFLFHRFNSDDVPILLIIQIIYDFLLEIIKIFPDFIYIWI